MHWNWDIAAGQVIGVITTWAIGRFFRWRRGASLRGIQPSGLLPDEQHVADLATNLWEAWLALPIQHPGDRADIGEAVHVVQDRLAIRIARRLYPSYWKTSSGVQQPPPP